MSICDPLDDPLKMRIDARLPVQFGPLGSLAPGEVVLLDQDLPPGPADAHAPECACCVARSGPALALATLFRQRAVGTGVPFRGVLAVVGPVAEAQLRVALDKDPFVAGRYRLDENSAIPRPFD